MSTFLIFALWYATIQGHFVHLHTTRFTNFYVIVNNMAIAMPQSTRAPPGGDNCSCAILQTVYSCKYQYHDMKDFVTYVRLVKWRMNFIFYFIVKMYSHHREIFERNL
jgi:hypothetical protein